MLAEAFRQKASGKDALAAYLLAVETDARLGLPAQGMLQKIGFHPTGLVGIFGCAVAAGFLARLDAGQIAAAQGIALSMASGSLEFLDDGAWTKRMHPGWAASSAIQRQRSHPVAFMRRRTRTRGGSAFYNIYLQNEDIATT